jgi:glycosyltransferase involved in cell wall biosynthesis
MKFSIVTPCFNAERYIEETISSILNQSALREGRATLQYIIVDGASTDTTLKRIESVCSSFQFGTVEIISEPDRSMYEALKKGLQQVDGDICAYLNAGDLYSEHAFDIVQEIFERGDVQWLTGLNAIYNEASYLVYTILPYRYRREWFHYGLYNGGVRGSRFVQQEVTFWRTDLLHNLDYEQLATYRYAGDYFLWMHFALTAELKIVQSYLGGYRRQRGQLSEDMFRYRSELLSMTDNAPIIHYLLATVEALLWHLPARMKKKFNDKGLFVFDHEQQIWI